MLPSPAELSYFIEIASTLNISRAAERLGISQPSLSLAVKRLEEPVTEDGRRAFLEELKRSMEAEPDVKKIPQGPLRIENLEGRPVLVIDQLRAGEVKMPRWIFVQDAWMLDLELSLAPGLPGRWERLAPQIAHGVQVQP